MPLDPFADIMLELAILLTMVLVARWLTSHFRQPGVLGELLVGVLVGNLGYWLGVPFFTFVMSYGAASPVFDQVWQGGVSVSQAAAQVFGPAELEPGGRGHEVLRLLSGDHALANVNTGLSLWLFSSLGIILLLFHVGLKTGIHQLRGVGTDAARVAIAGALGTLTVAFILLRLLPVEVSGAGRFFIAATLSATSIGVVTRMLEDIGKADTPEGREILGACVLNDLIGLVLLALSIELVVKGHLDLPAVAWLLVSSAAFLGAIVLFGDRLGRPFAHQLNRIGPVELRFLAPLAFAFLLAWLCSSLGLSGTVGGFAAGLILSDESLRDKTKEMLVPLIAVFTPIFFLLIGMQVNLAVFLDWQTLVLTIGLLFAAVVGKLPAGLVAGPDADRATVALGMLPRGEVALIFVGVGRSLDVIDDRLFAALVAVIILLAFGSGLALKWAFDPRSARAEELLGRLNRLLSR
ncbi:cation:proton antiporter [Rhabdochromatium marinum]|uniref:cation:proton antiporter n=1 Tax=Rhabdochromatium marinum TaxID=48729 RepID=UPI001904203D|nr:cation:proton antiporter [Rhabdochromatium marinum]